MYEGDVCTGSVAGVIPKVLDRALHFPKLRPGAACPTSRGQLINTPAVVGPGFEHGAVGFTDGVASHYQRGVVGLEKSDVKGWLAFKSIWFSSPRYQGPWIVRAERLGSRGSIALIDGAMRAALVVPPGPTLNEFSRWRTAPQGTYVTTQGCYAFQIDGLKFSYVIVIRAVVAH